MKAFDRKFGPEFIQTVPQSPGVYRIFDVNGKLVYVGKAKNLRRRLSQYRNAKRRKKHAKMREIVGGADSIQFELCASDADACLLEARLIQELRPKWNVAGAFYFLYPMIGMLRDIDGGTYFCYTTSPALFPGFTFHGAFRSRYVTREAFLALMNLLGFLVHTVDRPTVLRKISPAKPDRYASVFGFRPLPEEWLARLQLFWSGQSAEAMEVLVLSLIENATARRKSSRTQQQFNALKRFWRHEARPLADIRRLTTHLTYPITQKERDLLFLQAKQARMAKSAARTSASSQATREGKKQPALPRQREGRRLE